MKKKDDLLFRRIMRDLAKYPEKKAQYRKVLIEMGYIKNVAIKTKRVSAKELEHAEENGITFILT